MEGVELIDPTDFFNILNQEMTYPMLSDPCYLLLFDVRSLSQYMEDHILTAKLVSKNEFGEFQIPIDSEVETKCNIVVYDETTSDVLNPNSPAIAFASILWDNGSKNPVKVIKGGFQDFSALYPFLRTQEMLYTPQELDNMFIYPVEVLPRFLYVGNHRQSQAGRVNKDLKIKAHVNVSKSRDAAFEGRLEVPGKEDKPVPPLLEILIDDKKDEDLMPHFQNACNFIDSHRAKDGKSVLVFSDLGISRSITVAMAYLMHYKKLSLKQAWQYMKKCKRNMCPNRSFVQQLSLWEEQLFGKKISDLNDVEPY